MARGLYSKVIYRVYETDDTPAGEAFEKANDAQMELEKKMLEDLKKLFEPFKMEVEMEEQA